jgi:hypothetical protein
MSLNTRERPQHDVAEARYPLGKTGASAVDLVVHYAAALRDSEAGVTSAQGPGSTRYLEALELLNSAACTMATTEDWSRQVQAKSLELTQRAHADRHDTNERIACLREQLAVSEIRSANLAKQLDEAKQRSQISCDWLSRFQQAIDIAFASPTPRALTGGPHSQC